MDETGGGPGVRLRKLAEISHKVTWAGVDAAVSLARGVLG